MQHVNIYVESTWRGPDSKCGRMAGNSTEDGSSPGRRPAPHIPAVHEG